MKRDYKLFLNDIRDSVNFIEEYLSGKNAKLICAI
jgi:uncharacterized protein with HEPN domain